MFYFYIQTKLNPKNFDGVDFPGSSFNGCVFCSEFCCKLLTLVKAQTSKMDNYAHRGSRDRGNGRGRGRGRGRSGKSRRPR